MNEWGIRMSAQSWEENDAQSSRGAMSGSYSVEKEIMNVRMMHGHRTDPGQLNCADTQFCIGVQWVCASVL